MTQTQQACQPLLVRPWRKDACPRSLVERRSTTEAANIKNTTSSVQVERRGLVRRQIAVLYHCSFDDAGVEQITSTSALELHVHVNHKNVS